MQAFDYMILEDTFNSKSLVFSGLYNNKSFIKQVKTIKCVFCLKYLHIKSIVV